MVAGSGRRNVNVHEPERREGCHVPFSGGCSKGIAGAFQRERGVVLARLSLADRRGRREWRAVVVQQCAVSLHGTVDACGMRVELRESIDQDDQQSR